MKIFFIIIFAIFGTIILDYVMDGALQGLPMFYKISVLIPLVACAMMIVLFTISLLNEGPDK
jgi:hypothetical protein